MTISNRVARSPSADDLAQDRSDFQFSVKELSRKMSKPNESDWTQVERLAQYLKRVPRIVVKFKFVCQKSVSAITAWTGADCAGSGSDRSRMSTSVGLSMLGRPTIKHRAATQHTFAPSSGESEYYALVQVKASSQAIGLQSMLSDVNIGVSIVLSLMQVQL